MSALLALGFSSLSEVAALGTTAGEAVTAATGSEALGGAATGATVGAVSQGLTDVTKKAVDGIFGEGTADNIDKSFQQFEQGVKQFGGYIADPLSTTANPQNVYDFFYPPEDPKTNGKDLANLVNYFSSELAVHPQYSVVENKQPPESVVNSIVKNITDNNPTLKYLVPAVLEVGAKFVVPDNADYKAVEKIYNGNYIFPNTVATKIESDGTTTFGLLDETGKLNFWNTSYNNYTVIPPIYGTWVGINSPNNLHPLNDSLLDVFCFLHDISYHDEGSFNLLGDYQLISRVTNNIDRMVLPGERITANIAVNYFSTAGSIARRLFGTNHIDYQRLKTAQESGAIVENQEDKYSLDSTQPAGQLFGILKPNHTQEERDQFKEAFFNQLEVASRSSSVMAQTGGGYNYYKQRILSIFDNIQVQID